MSVFCEICGQIHPAAHDCEKARAASPSRRSHNQTSPASEEDLDPSLSPEAASQGASGEDETSEPRGGPFRPRPAEEVAERRAWGFKRLAAALRRALGGRQKPAAGSDSEKGPSGFKRGGQGLADQEAKIFDFGPPSASPSPFSGQGPRIVLAPGLVLLWQTKTDLGLEFELVGVPAEKPGSEKAGLISPAQSPKEGQTSPAPKIRPLSPSRASGRALGPAADGRVFDYIPDSVFQLTALTPFSDLGELRPPRLPGPETFAPTPKESPMSPNEPAKSLSPSADAASPAPEAQAPVQIRMAKAAEACCPDCDDSAQHDHHDHHDHDHHDHHDHDQAGPAASEGCCPSCDSRAPLVQISAPKEEGCCAACDSRAPLTEAGGHQHEEEGYSLKRLAAAAFLAIVSEVGHFSGLPEWLTITLAAAAALLGGVPTWIAGWKSLGRKKLDIMALMSVAVTGAVLIGEFSEAALVLTLFALAEKLEDRSVDKARRAIASLLSLAPEKAFVDDGQGGLIESKASEIAAGARVRVRPGEKLSLDGVVVEGTSAVDQAPITGESVPVQKFPGDQVFAGTLNISGVLDYEVTVPYGDSALSRIVKTVAAAESAKAPVERFVERFARIYTPLVFAMAIVAAIAPPLFLGGEWRSWIYRALALLVISCPCALVVSTPVAVLSALASATKKGLLVKGGVHLEEGRKLKSVAMDKTGTLTSGKHSRTDFEVLGGRDPIEADRLSASLASLSNHPVSQAIAKASEFKGEALASLTDFADRPGQGVSANYQGRTLYLGSAQLAAGAGAMDEALEAKCASLESQGKTVTILVDDGKPAALIATADTIKEDSLKAVSELRALGVKTVMLTGDNERAAAAVAAKVGVDSFRARLMPEDKLSVIEELSKDGKVGMAGDGINDAPALARADIGFSMGAAGTGTAIETADVAIMDDNLAKIPLFIRLSRAVHGILISNIFFILLVKLTFIVVTLMGRTDMWMAVMADIGVTLIVVANSMRLSRK